MFRMPSVSERHHRLGRSLTFSVLFSLGISVLYLPTALSFLPSSFGWGCAPCDQASCPPVACEEALQYLDGCGCCSLCARLEGERCGGQGDVAGRCNDSGLYCAYRLGNIFGDSRIGVCENELCQRKLCGYRERCGVVTGENGLTIKHCNCDHFLCKNKWNPLCGRDGQNYTSVCELQKTECLTGKPIGIQHFNECEPIESPAPLLPRKTNNIRPTHPQPSRCLHNEVWHNHFDIQPPTTQNPCTFYVCSQYGFMEQYSVLGCQGNPPERDWKVDEVVRLAEWSEWSPYGYCDGNCTNGGWKDRARNCTDPPPSTNPEAVLRARHCPGNQSESVLCEPSDCNMCDYGKWTEWSLCTAWFCDAGKRTRSRALGRQPEVPKLCENTTQTERCQFLKCANCSLTRSDEFHIKNNVTGCKSVRKTVARLCGGSCGEGKCCRGRPAKNQPYVTIGLKCSPNYPEYIEYFRHETSCQCVDCSEPYNPPKLLRAPWHIIY